MYKRQDLELIKDEYTFAMNSISLLFDKTDFRPSFYGCIDEGVFEKMKDSIMKYDSPNTKVFISGRLRTVSYTHLDPEPAENRESERVSKQRGYENL